MTATLYTPEQAERILMALGRGRTLTSLGEDPGFPDRATIYRWMSRHPQFGRRCREAIAGRQVVLRRHRSHAGEGRRPALVYGPRVRERIARMILEGASLSDVAAAPGMPPIVTLCLWLRRHRDFRRSYAIACKLRDLTLAEGVLQAVDASAGVPGEQARALRRWAGAGRARVSRMRPKKWFWF